MSSIIEFAINMGVRGLTTFIAKNSDEYFEQYELHDCSLVIDGNNLAAQLYKFVSKCNSAFGGDYDVYCESIINFFDLLKTCKIQPFILFDGGYETKKKKSVYSRLIAKQSAAQILCPANQSSLQIFPLMMRDVLRDILRELHLPFMQCDFEADDEIADVAREISSPVLSNDSDFYIYDVQYIPFSTLDLKISVSENGYSYISCRIYKIENFVNTFGGLKKEMLPLLATLLGNDYINRSTFKNFYAHLKLHKTKKKISDQQRTIAALLQWLRNETYESAIEKILGRLKTSERARVLQQIVKTVNGYLEGTNNASLFLGIKESLLNKYINSSMSQESQLTNSEFIEYLNSLYTNNKLNINAKFLIEQENISPEEQFFHKIPNWFRYLYNKGLFPSYFMDFIINRTVYSNPQIEDANFSDTNSMIIPILTFIFKIMNNRCDSFTYVGRNDHNRIAKHKIEVTEQFQSIKFPGLPSLNSYYPCKDLFLAFMKETTTMENFDILRNIPDSLHLYVLSIYWFGINMDGPKLLSSHIHAIILCMLYLQFIDPVIIQTRSLGKLKNAYEKNMKDDSSLKAEFEIETFLTPEEIPLKECYSSALNLVPYFKMDDKLKTSTKLFSRQTVHIFSKFQSVVQQMNVLNSLLGHPFTSCKVHKLYNGTFIYNAYTQIKNRNNILCYIKLLLEDAPALYHNYCTLFSLLRDLLPTIFDESKVKKKKRRKAKKSNISVTENLESCSDCETDSENIVIDAKNNVYWLLNNIID